MSKSNAIREMEGVLVSLQLSRGLDERGKGELNLIYPLVEERLADATPGLVALDMYERVRFAVSQSMAFVAKNRHDEAITLLGDVGRELMDKSGTTAKLRKLYQTPKKSTH